MLGAGQIPSCVVCGEYIVGPTRRRYCSPACKRRRSHHGGARLTALGTKERPCMMCEEPFLSTWAGNRRCPACSYRVRSWSLDVEMSAGAERGIEQAINGPWIGR